MTESAQPVLDAQALNDNTMSDRGLQAELFQIFFDQATHYLDMLRDSVVAREAEAWTAAAHGLRGASLALGLTRLARRAAQAEASSPRPEAAEALAAALEESRLAALRYLEESAA
ncbi:Hpt domain-containing protein [Neomegalonema sp.]|uniref:Hpt domain-containing protein n=1 Tax=Neomegalonema sp. TaxID=2039713 RepID=UPI002609A3F6|nr:Hpt domain-containing protein [Neomegalonema sp.]MDD2868801.1 Hpt domain-containing protein [Neomegalonema sp.]